jgi:integrase
MPKTLSFDRLSAGDYEVSNVDTKYISARLIRMLVLATNKHKLDYGSLRYIHRQVIRRTKLDIPRKPKKLYDLPTSDDLEGFFSVISDPQEKLIFLVLENTGIRVEEVCSIEVAKIDFKSMTIFITGKGNKDRIIQMTSTLADKILLFLSGRNHRYLFETKLGTRYSTRRVEQLCQKFKTDAKIQKKLSPHTFRHLFFSRLAELGVSPDIRAMMAGHSDTKTQDIYTHIGLAGSKELIIEALEKMEFNRRY